MKGRKRNIVTNGGPPMTPVPLPPDWLPPYAKETWYEVAPILHHRGELGVDTAASLESYCINIALIRECEEVMQEEGRVVDGKPHGAFRIQTNAMRESRLLAAEMGLSINRRPKQEPKDEGNADLQL